ncbi:reticulon-1a isoform 1-T1 [Synchiropus picturatus]
MSARPGDELDSEGKWFGDVGNGLSGDTSTRFDEGFKARGAEMVMGDLDQEFNPVRDEGKRSPVAMETASTDDPMSGLLRKADDGELYTSLLSGQNFSSGLEASFMSDSKKPSSGSSGMDTFFTESYSYSSSTKTDFNLLDDMPKSLVGADKTESYNYMDISHSDERKEQHKLVDPGFAGHDSQGSYIDKTPGREEEDDDDEEEEEENLGPALGSHSFPYVEEPSDEELSDYRSYRTLGGTPQTASPVKITLTESHPPPAAKAEPRKSPSPVGGLERENVLSVGQQGVPTVTLSEPEDESPASTPNASPTHKQFPSNDMFKVDTVKAGVPKTSSGHRGHDGSSAESGDSDIELVSEEPLKASANPFTQAPKSKDVFESPPASKAGLGNHAAPPSYSILREEREAELDTDLFIESASEESPKRGHDLKEGVGAPSPLVPSSVTPSSPPPAKPVEPPIKPKSQAEEDHFSKPKPPTAAVTPELRSDTQQQEDKHEHGDVVKCSVSKLLMGFDKQKAIDLLYWRNVKQSGAVFSSVLLLLFSLTQFSVVSVGAYLALAALSATISFRIYKSVLQAVQKTDEGHPFKAYLEVELALSQDQISKYADKILLYTNTCMRELRRLFLVQDLIDSLKFAVLMWLLTYVGALFNGLTLLILAVISMFTMPVVYEKHQAQIDQYVGLIRGHVNAVVGKIQAKIPGAKRKEE